MPPIRPSHPAYEDRPRAIRRISLTTALGRGILDLHVDVLATTQPEAEALAKVRQDEIVALANQSFSTLAKGEHLTCSSRLLGQSEPDGACGETADPSPPATDTRASFADYTFKRDTIPPEIPCEVPTHKRCSTIFLLERESDLFVCEMAILRKRRDTAGAGRRRSVAMILDFVAAIPDVDMDDIVMESPSVARFRNTFRLTVWDTCRWGLIRRM